MTGTIPQRLAGLSPRAVALCAATLTAAVELVTVVLRFGFRLEAQAHTSWLAPFTLGFRVHHGYWGVLLLVAAGMLWRRPAVRNALLIAGAALVMSDAIHHLLVLWPITGSPEFHLRYGAG